MVTGFIKLNGMTVGAVANNDTDMTARGAYKAAEFINFCDAFNIPVLSVTNVKGYKANMCTERNIAKAMAKLTYAFANATVPKVNVIAGAAYGSAYVTMNSKALGADVVYAWKGSEIGMMDSKLAAKIMYAGADAATLNEKAAEYAALQSSAEAAARRGYVDSIIEAQDTRKYVIGAFEMLFTKREDRPVKKHGTV
jgi:acetyl-CoA carboxylase carboxyltransferase component